MGRRVLLGFVIAHGTRLCADPRLFECHMDEVYDHYAVSGQIVQSVFIAPHTDQI